MSSDDVVITVHDGISGSPAMELGIVEQLGIQFQQQISTLFDLAGDRSPAQGTVNNSGHPVPVYYVGGRTSGQLSMQRVIGINIDNVKEFYRRFGDVCRPVDLNFTLDTSCDGLPGTGTAAAGVPNPDAPQYSAKACVLTSMSMQVESQTVVIREQLQCTFANLLYE
jgi:hypothetical protein